MRVKLIKISIFVAMFLSIATYRKILVIALLMLLVIPCSVKRDLKKWFQIETNQQSNQGKFKISCSNYSELNQNHKNKKFQKHILHSHFSSDREYSFAFSEKRIFPDLYHQQKEKIASYILFESFLI